MASPTSEVQPGSAARRVACETADEPPSLIGNAAAGAFSLLLLATLETFPSSVSLGLPETMARGWFLMMDLLPYNPLVDATIGTMVLTVVAVGLQLVQRTWRVPDWLPLVLAWPTALVLVGPSAIEHADDWDAWLVVGAGTAVVFCLHWLCLLLARELLD